MVYRIVLLEFNNILKLVILYMCIYIFRSLIVEIEAIFKCLLSLFEKVCCIFCLLSHWRLVVWVSNLQNDSITLQIIRTLHSPVSQKSW